MLPHLLLASYGLAQAAALEHQYALTGADPFLVSSAGRNTVSSAAGTDTTTFSARNGLEIAVHTPLLGAQFSGRVLGASASLLLQAGRQRKNELAEPGAPGLLIGDTFAAADGLAGAKLSTRFDGELELGEVSLTLPLASDR